MYVNIIYIFINKFLLAQKHYHKCTSIYVIYILYYVRNNVQNTNV